MHLNFANFLFQFSIRKIETTGFISSQTALDQRILFFWTEPICFAFQLDIKLHLHWVHGLLLQEASVYCSFLHHALILSCRPGFLVKLFFTRCTSVPTLPGFWGRSRLTKDHGPWNRLGTKKPVLTPLRHSKQMKCKLKPIQLCFSVQCA